MLKEQIRELMEQVQLLMTLSKERGAASSAESSAESSPEEMTWTEEKARRSSVGTAWDHLTEQAGVVLTEIGGHSSVSMCSIMEELSDKKIVLRLECNRSRLPDSKHRWSLKVHLELERPRHLWPVVQTEMSS